MSTLLGENGERALLLNPLFNPRKPMMQHQTIMQPQAVYHRQCQHRIMTALTIYRSNNQNQNQGEQQ
jgi:hypothetical protein